MNKVISIHEAKTNLSKLIKQAAAGETVYIGGYGVAQVVLAPLPDMQPVMRQLGQWRGKSGVMIADDFDAINNEVADMFEGDILE